MMEQHHVIIALGSNVGSDFLPRARELMGAWLNVNAASDIITTEPIGMSSPDFHNQLLECTTTLAPDELTLRTKAAEQALGRQHGRGIVAIDIDIMQYDDTLLHPDDWNREYIRKLYCQIKKTTHL
ncbi:MAG: 2-amino-4-hydroxy-6-hydroxymethyldihydropteridine diphosphokinase [Prevotella sp.]